MALPCLVFRKFSQFFFLMRFFCVALLAFNHVANGLLPSFISTKSVTMLSLSAVKAKKKTKVAASGGFGSKKVVKTASFDAPAALLKSEKLYEEVRVG